MEMSVYSRNVAMYSKEDEQYTSDDRNNNVKNVQMSNKPLTMHEEHHKQIDFQIKTRTDDELQLKCENNDKFQAEKCGTDTRSNDSNLDELAAATKSSVPLNFSVDSILGSTNAPQKCDKGGFKQSIAPMALSKFSVMDDFNRIHRPMPMRYVSASSIYQGFPLNNSTIPLHRPFKYPLPNYHCTSLGPQSASFASNFGIDRYLLPNTVPYPHFHQSSHHRTDCLVDPTNPKITSIPPPSVTSVNSTTLNQQTKRKRSWSRAVFSQLQRKGLEIQFQIQKYITKPDRRKLAARLGLTDAQVKVWFQNRRMKWRHSKLESKSEKNRITKAENKDDDEHPDHCESSLESDTSSSDGENEIDIEAE